MPQIQLAHTYLTLCSRHVPKELGIYLRVGNSVNLKYIIRVRYLKDFYLLLSVPLCW